MLQVDIQIGTGQALHVFNIHLGTSYMERRSQAAQLLSADVLGQEALSDPRLVVGDFNEWTVGLTSRLLQRKLQDFPAAAWFALSPHLSGHVANSLPGPLLLRAATRA